MTKEYYYRDCFPENLKTARLYRQEWNAADISKKIKISSRLWYEYEKGKQIPETPLILTIANTLGMALIFFFTPGADPRHYDLVLFEKCVSEECE